MEVILLQRIAKLGQMGETVRVKDGFARNFLLPQGKALRATKDNKAKFEAMKAQLEARNLEQRGEAEKVADKLNGYALDVLRQASETGQLFGSVSTRDLAALLDEAGFTVNRTQIALNAPIKMIGRHVVPIALHPEVDVTVTVNVARNVDEIERLRRGEDITISRERTEAQEALEVAQSMFERPEEAELGTPEGEAPAEAEGKE